MAENVPSISIIEGTVKFRDGKKWKSRWCVMRKLSPVADCVHLQLYKDQKERQNNGPTKCSLSLQQYFGYETGFTLDKESNTLAILCEDIVPVIAFDTRELLINWKVKVQHYLGPCREYSALLISAPSTSKIRPGPIRLYFKETKLAISTGRPPLLALIWNINMLKRYGMVKGKLCIEGGSCSGQGAGLFVINAERGKELLDVLTGAALDQTAGSRHSVASTSNSVFEKRLSESLSCAGDFNMLPSSTHTWNESQSPARSYFMENHPTATIKRPISLARCSSCVLKSPPVLSRSSTMPIRPGPPKCPSWTKDKVIERYSDSDRNSICSRSSGSDYSVPRSIHQVATACSTPVVPIKSMSQYCESPSKCSCKRKLFSGSYENYDVPKAPMPLVQQNQTDTLNNVSYYDTPKRLMKCLQSDTKNCLCTTIKEKSNQNNSPEEIETQPVDVQCNYINATPITKEQETIFDSNSLQNFESSVDILKSAGFSQEEIEALEDIPEVEDVSIEDDSVMYTPTDISDGHYNDEKSENSINENTSADAISRLSHLSDPSAKTCSVDNGLSTRRTLSAEILKQLDASEQLYFGDVSNNYDEVITEDDFSDLKSKEQENFIKSGSSLVARFRDSVRIRRSSSFPTKSMKNRDSSSSNDSGVSTGSLKNRKLDLFEFEIPIRTWNTNKKDLMKRQRDALHQGNEETLYGTAYAAPLQDISFRFDEVTDKPSPMTATLRRNKPGEDKAHRGVRDSGLTAHSSSSDTSDYLESLSLSSFSSADATPASSRHSARPRSGREYLSRDRTKLIQL